MSVAEFLQLPDDQQKFIDRLGDRGSAWASRARSALADAMTEAGEIDWYRYWQLLQIEMIPKGLAPGTPPDQILAELPDLIQEILNHDRDARRWPIIQYRFGLKGASRLTFEELGTVWGLTRERVRQLEASTLAQLQALFFEDDYAGKAFHVHPQVSVAIRRLAAVVRENWGEPALKSQLPDQIRRRLLLDPEPLLPTIYLVLSFSGLTRVAFGRPLNRFLAPFWIDAPASEMRLIYDVIKRIHKILTKEHVLPMSESDLLREVNKARRKRPVTLEQLKTSLNLYGPLERHPEGGYWVKFEYVAGRGNQMQRILFEHGEPTHYKQIVEEINRRSVLPRQRPLNERSLAHQIAGDTRFAPIGRSGEWGLSEWSMETSTIRSLMKEYLLAKNEPATAAEIYAYVNERRPAQWGSIMSYLTSSKDFIRVDRGRWAPAGWPEGGDAQIWNPEQVRARFKRKKGTLRAKVNDFVLALLEAAPGRQMALAEVVERLVHKFGRTNKTFYQYIGDMACVEKFTLPDTNRVMCRLKEEPP